MTTASCLARLHERRLGGTLEVDACGRTGWHGPGPPSKPRTLGAVLLFDFNNIRYVTSTHIGEWARDKMTRYALLRGAATRTSGTSARPPSTIGSTAPGCGQRTCTPAWSACAARSPPDAGLFTRAAREIRDILRAEGAADMPIGVDIVEPPMLAALEAEGITVRDAQQVDARRPRGQVASTRSCCSTRHARWSTARTSSSRSSSSRASARASWWRT